jgi:hypothetical protein
MKTFSKSNRMNAAQWTHNFLLNKTKNKHWRWIKTSYKLILCTFFCLPLCFRKNTKKLLSVAGENDNWISAPEPTLDIRYRLELVTSTTPQGENVPVGERRSLLLHFSTFESLIPTILEQSGSSQGSSDLSMSLFNKAEVNKELSIFMLWIHFSFYLVYAWRINSTFRIKYIK